MGNAIRRLIGFFTLSDALYFIASLGPRILTFGTMLVLAHTLTAEDFGRVSLIVTTSLVILTLSSAWLSTSAYRFVADRNPMDRQEAEANLLAAYPWSFAFVSILVASFGALTGQPSFIYLSAILLGLLSGSGDLASAFLNAQSRPKDYMSISLFRTGFIFIFASICGYFRLGLVGATIAYVFGSTAIILSPAFRGIFAKLRFRVPSKTHVWQFMRYGVPAGLSFNIYILVHAGSRLALANIAGPEQVGRYALVSDLFYAPAALILGTFGLSYMPKMHGGWLDSGREGALPWINKYLSTQIAFAFPILAGGLALGDLFWTLLAPNQAQAGEAWLAGLATIQGLCLAMIGCFIMILQVMGRTGACLIFTLACALANWIVVMIFGQANALDTFAAVSTGCITLSMVVLGTYTLSISGARVGGRRLAQFVSFALGLFAILLIVRQGINSFIGPQL
jgi:O-antigen/teichoic acid export membrane protein